MNPIEAALAELAKPCVTSGSVDGRLMWDQLMFLSRGVHAGHWQDVDPILCLPILVRKRSEWNEFATMAHVWFSLGRFKSMKEAKRAGWSKPITAGTHRLRTYLVRIEDDTEG